MKKRLLLFSIPVALFVAQLPLSVWRFRTLDCLLTAAPAFLVLMLGSLVLATAFGGLCLLLLWLHCRLNRRPLARPAATFLAPTLVVFTLLSALFFWIELGFAIQDHAIVRMNRAWDAANPQTEADVRRLFGEPDEIDDFPPPSAAARWFYHTSRFPSLIPSLYQVWFDSDGTVTNHGAR